MDRRSALQFLASTPLAAILPIGSKRKGTPFEEIGGKSSRQASIALPFDVSEFNRIVGPSGLPHITRFADMKQLSFVRLFQEEACKLTSQPNIFEPLRVEILAKDGSLWGGDHTKSSHEWDAVKVFRGFWEAPAATIRRLEMSERHKRFPDMLDLYSKGKITREVLNDYSSLLDRRLIGQIFVHFSYV